MPVHAIDVPDFTSPQTASLGCWLGPSSHATVTVGEVISSIPPTDRTDPVKIAAALTTLLQSRTDTVVARSTLPANDPARQADPGLPNFFWSGINLVARPVQVQVKWELNRYRLYLTRLGAA